MQQTGQRGVQKPHPGNTTGMAFYRQQREQEAKRAAASQVVDLAAVRESAHAEGFEAGFVRGGEWAFEQLASAGIDVDAVLALQLDTDDQADDEPGER
jgi:hypothetical protein